jgi:hypothetical protein
VYYVGIETSLPASPAAPPPLKAACVVPFGMEGRLVDDAGPRIPAFVGSPARPLPELPRPRGTTTQSGTLVEVGFRDLGR